jgi:hypothetical protein
VDSGSGISDMLGGILSNPDALNKIMTMAPMVAQMMSGGGNAAQPTAPDIPNISNISNTPSTPNISNNTPSAAMPALPAGKTAGDLMANPQIAAALANLMAAINSANHTPDSAPQPHAAPEDQDAPPEARQPAAPAFAGIPSAPSPPMPATPPTSIEKTLDTLKNFTSATSPEADHRLKLLLALKPFLKDGRKTKIDHAVKYMNAAKIISMFGKNGFV